MWPIKSHLKVLEDFRLLNLDLFINGWIRSSNRQWMNDLMTCKHPWLHLNSTAVPLQLPRASGANMFSRRFGLRFDHRQDVTLPITSPSSISILLHLLTRALLMYSSWQALPFSALPPQAFRAEACRARPKEKVRAQGRGREHWFMAFRLMVASSSLWPPDRKVTPWVRERKGQSKGHTSLKFGMSEWLKPAWLCLVRNENCLKINLIKVTTNWQCKH